MSLSEKQKQKANDLLKEKGLNGLWDDLKHHLRKNPNDDTKEVLLSVMDYGVKLKSHKSIEPCREDLITQEKVTLPTLKQQLDVDVSKNESKFTMKQKRIVLLFATVAVLIPFVTFLVKEHYRHQKYKQLKSDYDLAIDLEYESKKSLLDRKATVSLASFDKVTNTDPAVRTDSGFTYISGTHLHTKISKSINLYSSAIAGIDQNYKTKWTIKLSDYENGDLVNLSGKDTLSNGTLVISYRTLNGKKNKLAFISSDGEIKEYSKYFWEAYGSVKGDLSVYSLCRISDSNHDYLLISGHESRTPFCVTIKLDSSGSKVSSSVIKEDNYGAFAVSSYNHNSEAALFFMPEYNKEKVGPYKSSIKIITADEVYNAEWKGFEITYDDSYYPIGFQATMKSGPSEQQLKISVYTNNKEKDPKAYFVKFNTENLSRETLYVSSESLKTSYVPFNNHYYIQKGISPPRIIPFEDGELKSYNLDTPIIEEAHKYSEIQIIQKIDDTTLTIIRSPKDNIDVAPRITFYHINLDATIKEATVEQPNFDNI